MAPRSKKNSNKSSGNKKRTTVKKTTEKTIPSKKRNKSKKILHTKRNIFIVIISLMIISLISFGYFLGQRDIVKNVYDNTQKENYSTKELLDDLSKIKTKKPQEEKRVAEKKVVKKILPSNKKREKKQLHEKIIPKEQKSVKIKSQKIKKKKEVALAYRGKRPKLVVIIDDVHTTAQLKAIKDLHMKVTPSIFPPYKLAPKSNLLARGVDHYMIHLPMESGNRQFNTQYKTLQTSFSKEQMETRVKEIKALFPTAKYINNHTGSVFTDNYQAMHTLYQLLRKYGFVFLDSRTIGSTKVRKIAHEFGDAYVARDIFIDNKHDVAYIHKQLAQAVSIAKKKGYAVAIGHPHKVTMQALASSKQILKDVELVYIDDIYAKR